MIFHAVFESGTVKDLLDLAEQAKKFALRLDPKRTKEIIEAEHMKGFLEPHFEGDIRKSGDLYISRNRAGTHCYVYFTGEKH